MNLSRRELLQGAAGAAALGLLPVACEAGSNLEFGSPEAFSFDLLRKRAEKLAGANYRPAPPRHPDLLQRIDYDAYQKIRYRSGQALWAGSDSRLPVEFFHLGRYFQQPVSMHVVRKGQARRVHFHRDLFSYDDKQLADRLPPDLGFAGFRVMNPSAVEGDWLAFLGASYFRSSGPENQYGLSARGIAVNTVVPGMDEEFPRFTAFWLEAPPGDADLLTVYALLDGPSLSGAYRFDCRLQEAAVVTDVHCELFQRAGIERLGIAPLTSMYWYSETNHRESADWRPEIHDSDGLALWTGAGERIWRPLNSPPHIQTNQFFDTNPRGFGLLQRDRLFGHYQDDGVFYDRRPSVWVEPEGDWGAGSVILIEMPTNDEIDDNIVAMWTADREAAAGTHWSLDYRLHWTAVEPYPPSLSHCIATRIGRAGMPGQHAERDPNGRKFVIDFRGGPLAALKQRYDLEVIATASRGYIRNSHCLKVVGTDDWRASFDLHAEGGEPVDLRCYVRLGDRTLTETWVYQYFPADHRLS